MGKTDYALSQIVSCEVGLPVAWAREVHPSQPVTSGVWLGDHPSHPTALQNIQLEESDVISFHNYDGPDDLRKRIEGLKKLGRSVLCTEYMARGNHSTFKDNLPVLKESRIAAWNWGLANGKSNTIYPWDSWKHHYFAEPAVWFHDIFRADGTPFSSNEAELIIDLSLGKNASRSLPEPAKSASRISVPAAAP